MTLSRLLAEFPDSELAPNAQFTIGDYHYNEGQYEKALEAYKGLVRDHPDAEVAAVLAAEKSGRSSPRRIEAPACSSVSSASST